MIPKEFSFLAAGIIAAVTGAVEQTYSPIRDLLAGRPPYIEALYQGNRIFLVRSADIRECSELEERLGKGESERQMRKNAIRGLASLPPGILAQEVNDAILGIQTYDGKSTRVGVDYGIALTTNTLSSAKREEMKDAAEEIAGKLCYSGSA